MPGREAVARTLDKMPWRQRPFAVPPVGSALRGVPGTAGLPLIGRSAEIILDPTMFSRRSYDRYGPVSWTSGFGLRIVTALGPDATQAILTNGDKAYSQGGWEYFIGPFFRRGLMLLDFDEHRLHRRIMQEAFTRSRLEGYLERVDVLVCNDLKRWPANGQIFAYPTLKRLSLDIATDIFMGGVVGNDDDKLQTAFIDSVRAGTALIRRPVPRWPSGAREVLPFAAGGEAGDGLRRPVLRAVPCAHRRRRDLQR
jgi:cytochrome P450